MVLTAILSIFILSACMAQKQTEEPTQEVVPEPIEETAPAEPEPVVEQVVEEQPPQRVETEPTPAPLPLHGAIPIELSESTKVISLDDYPIDRGDNVATLKGVSFTIRNTGKEPIRPRVVMQLSGDGFNVNKIWDYERLLNGYKFEKDVKLTITLDAPKLMKVMKVTVLDLDKGMEELGSDTKQFIPLPQKK